MKQRKRIKKEENKKKKKPKSFRMIVKTGWMDDGNYLVDYMVAIAIIHNFLSALFSAIHWFRLLFHGLRRISIRLHSTDFCVTLLPRFLCVIVRFRPFSSPNRKPIQIFIIRSTVQKSNIFSISIRMLEPDIWASTFMVCPFHVLRR